ncbi:MAG: hypothetical protein AVDCRST_MAG12-248, partial [uncultured Rubrobacteraceae bacterium]
RGRSSRWTPRGACAASSRSSRSPARCARSSTRLPQPHRR